MVEITRASTSVSCPLYACAFDPADSNRLLVGGGGGPRNGVGNRLFYIDTSDPSELSKLGEHEFDGQGDNLTSLAVARSNNKNTTLVYAGVNSPAEDIKKGKNHHFRTLAVHQPARSAKSSGVPKVAEQARDTLFLHSDGDSYQRLLALSHPHEGSSSQIGAIASAFAKTPEIVLFDVSASTGAATTRARLDIVNEAMDLDVCQTGPNTYQLAYCDDHQIYTVEVSKVGISEPKCVYEVKPEEGETKKPAFRSLRYLTPGFLLTTVHKPNSAGAVLHGYRLPDKDADEDTPARLAIQKKLPKAVTRTTGLAVRNLSPPASPDEQQEDSQFVVAVAGIDSSISLLTLEHKTSSDVDMLTDLAPIQTLNSGHTSNITSLSFSTFAPPKTGSNKKPQLSVKLASVGMGNTTVVHSIPLKQCIDSSIPKRKDGSPSPSRYVVALNPQAEYPVTIWSLFAVMALLLAIAGQYVFQSVPQFGANAPHPILLFILILLILLATFYSSQYVFKSRQG